MVAPKVMGVVPVAQGDTARATAASTVPVPEPSALAVRYHRIGNAVWVADVALALLVPAAFLFTGCSARLRSLAWRIGRRLGPAAAAYGALFAAASYLVHLPLSFYSGYALEHSVGLATQTVGDWAAGAATGLLLGSAGAALLAPVPYLLLARHPRRWWLLGGLATVPGVVLFIVVAPVWIAPRFDRYAPLADPALERRVRDLAARAGLGPVPVRVVEKSDETRGFDAAVVGLAGTRRIVLWDTVVDDLEPEQVLFVVAHELGHFVLGHALWTIVSFAALVTAALFAADRLAPRVIRRYRARLGFDRLSDVASLPLLLLVGGLVRLATVPATLAVSRTLEREADRFALELTRDNRAAALAIARVHQHDLVVPRPGPLYVLWRADHPPFGERLEFANRYRPWATGGTLRYGDRFRARAPGK